MLELTMPVPHVVVAVSDEDEERTLEELAKELIAQNGELSEFATGMLFPLKR